MYRKMYIQPFFKSNNKSSYEQKLNINYISRLAIEAEPELVIIHTDISLDACNTWDLGFFNSKEVRFTQKCAVYSKLYSTLQGMLRSATLYSIKKTRITNTCNTQEKYETLVIICHSKV